MPVAIPTWRNVLLMPEAMPLRGGSTTPTAVEASGGFARPTPAPATMKPASSGSSRRPGRARASAAGRCRRASPRRCSSLRAARGTQSLPGDRRDDERDERHRQEAHAGLQRRVAERRPACRASGRGTSRTSPPTARRRRASADEGRPAEQREVEHRPSPGRSTTTKRHQQDAAAPPGSRRSAVLAQPSSLPRTSAKTSRNSAAEKVTRPRVDARALRVARLVHLPSVSDDAAMPIGTFTKKIHCQPMRLGEHAADQRPDRDRARRRRAPDAERRAPLAPVERLGEQRQRGGEHRRPADALQAAGEVQHRAASSAGRTAARPR